MITVTESQTSVFLPRIKFENRYILYLILSRFYVFTSIWIIFLYSLGYSIQLVLLFNFITLGVTITFEIPAGFVAEFLGQKLTLLIAYLFYFTSVSILLINYSLPFLLISNFFWGVGSSLSTDTEDIWLYNQLMVENNFDRVKTEKEFSNLYSKLIFLGFFSTGVSEIIGSICYKVSVTLPIILSACTMLVTIYWIQIVPSIPYIIENESKNRRINYLEQMHEFAKLNIFKLIIGFIILNSILFNVIVWFPNYLVSMSMNSSLISTTIGLGTFLTGLGILFSNKFLTGKKSDNKIKSILILIPILVLNLAIQTSFFLLFNILIIQVIYGSLLPYYKVKVILNLPKDKKQIYLSIVGEISYQYI